MVYSAAGGGLLIENLLASYPTTLVCCLGLVTSVVESVTLGLAWLSTLAVFLGGSTTASWSVFALLI